MCFREIHSGALCRLLYLCIYVCTSKDNPASLTLVKALVFVWFFLYFIPLSLFCRSHTQCPLSACRLPLNVCRFCTLWCHRCMAAIFSVKMITCVCPDHLIMSAMFVSPHDAGYVCSLNIPKAQHCACSICPASLSSKSQWVFLWQGLMKLVIFGWWLALETLPLTSSRGQRWHLHVCSWRCYPVHTLKD